MKKKENINQMNQYLKGLSEADLKAIGNEFKLIRISRSEGLDWYDFGHSISYYSKFENGKIIPKYEVLAEICEERGIEENEINSLILAKEILKKAIPSLYYHENDYLEEAYNNLKSFKNARANLVLGLYYVMNHNVEDTLYTIMYLYPISSGFDEYDTNIFNYIKLWYYHQEKDYKSIKNLMPYFSNLQDEYLEALIQKEIFYALCEYGLDDPKFYYDQVLKAEMKLLSKDTQNVIYAYYKASIGYGYQMNPSILSRLPRDLQLQYYLVNKIETKLNDESYLATLSTFELLLAQLVLDYKVEARQTIEELMKGKLSPFESFFINWAYVYATFDIEGELKYLSKTFLPYLYRTKQGYLFGVFFNRLKTLSKDTAKYKSIVDAMELYQDLEKNRILCSL